MTAFFHAITLRAMARVLSCLWLAWASPGHAEPPLAVTLSAPGPRNLSYLPVDLMPRLQADRQEGLTVTIRHTGGGGIALKHLADGTSDFAVAGLPAQLSMQSQGGHLITLMAVNDAPLFILMVRSDLADQIKRPADLQGRTIGVNTSSMTSKTTSQQLAELLLQQDGLAVHQVRFVAAGQNWETQSGLIRNKAVDAIMGDEPFASRLRHAGQVFFLADISDPAFPWPFPGSNFLHAALATHPRVAEREPVKIHRMVAAMRRTLQWLATHTPEETIDRLEVADPEERASLISALRQYPRLYSRDGQFSSRQLAETQTFFRAANPAASVEIETMVDDLWAGRKP